MREVHTLVEQNFHSNKESVDRQGEGGVDKKLCLSLLLCWPRFRNFETRYQLEIIESFNVILSSTLIARFSS